MALVSECYRKSKSFETVAFDVNRHKKDDFIKAVLPEIPKLFKKNVPPGQEERVIGNVDISLFTSVC
jgi:hypothetical protein